MNFFKMFNGSQAHFIGIVSDQNNFLKENDKIK